MKYSPGVFLQLHSFAKQLSYTPQEGVAEFAHCADAPNEKMSSAIATDGKKKNFIPINS